jgi:hypothetical protein
LKEHLDGLRFKGMSLSEKEIFYILREMIIASSYLNRKKMKVRSFDPGALYLSSSYEVKIPYENIDYENCDEQSRYFRNNQNNQVVLYLSPEELNINRNIT